MKNNFLSDNGDPKNWNIGTDKEFDNKSFGVVLLQALVLAGLVFGFLFVGSFV